MGSMENERKTITVASAVAGDWRQVTWHVVQESRRTSNWGWRRWDIAKDTDSPDRRMVETGEQRRVGGRWDWLGKRGPSQGSPGLHSSKMKRGGIRSETISEKQQQTQKTAMDAKSRQKNKGEPVAVGAGTLHQTAGLAEGGVGQLAGPRGESELGSREGGSRQGVFRCRLGAGCPFDQEP